MERFTYAISTLLYVRLADSLVSRVQASKRSNMGRAVLEAGSSADIHKLCFQATKRSHVYCVEVNECLFTDSQVGYFQAAKISDKSSTIIQEVRFADVEE